jgi:hypothetical protein
LIRSAVDYFSVVFIVSIFAMIAGGTITAMQIYKPQNILGWSESQIIFLWAFAHSKTSSFHDRWAWIDDPCPCDVIKESFNTSVSSFDFLPFIYSCLRDQANSFLNWHWPSLYFADISRARATSSFPSRASTCLPHICSQFRKYHRYNYWCVVPYYNQ